MNVRHIAVEFERQDITYGVDDDGVVIVDLTSDDHAALFTPHHAGVWVEVYAPGIPDTPVVSLHVNTPAEAAALVRIWQRDYAAHRQFTGRCQCGALVGPADQHTCGHTD